MRCLANFPSRKEKINFLDHHIVHVHAHAHALAPIYILNQVTDFHEIWYGHILLCHFIIFYDQ
jgi:hypothetical protein